MAPFADVSQVETVLETMVSREDGPLVVRLPREPGRRDSRWAHLFSGPLDIAALEAAAPPPAAPAAAADAASAGRLERLEQTVRELREEVDELKRRLAPPA
jgi:uncharacterized protein YceH (UPF0502 family)